jgi:hypothetical protein
MLLVDHLVQCLRDSGIENPEVKAATLTRGLPAYMADFAQSEFPFAIPIDDVLVQFWLVRNHEKSDLDCINVRVSAPISRFVAAQFRRELARLSHQARAFERRESLETIQKCARLIAMATNHLSTVFDRCTAPANLAAEIVLAVIACYDDLRDGDDTDAVFERLTEGLDGLYPCLRLAA